MAFLEEVLVLSVLPDARSPRALSPHWSKWLPGSQESQARHQAAQGPKARAPSALPSSAVEAWLTGWVRAGAGVSGTQEQGLLGQWSEGERGRQLLVALEGPAVPGGRSGGS